MGFKMCLVRERSVQVSQPQLYRMDYEHCYIEVIQKAFLFGPRTRLPRPGYCNVFILYSLFQTKQQLFNRLLRHRRQFTPLLAITATHGELGSSQANPCLSCHYFRLEYEYEYEYEHIILV